MSATKNPVISTTNLDTAHGWQVRSYADGTFDAAYRFTPTVSVALNSFRAAVCWAQDEQRGLDPIKRVNQEGTRA